MEHTPLWVSSKHGYTCSGSGICHSASDQTAELVHSKCQVPTLFLWALPAQGEGGAGSSSGGQVLVYLRPEDEFLHRASEWSFTFPVENRVVGKDDLAPLRLVALVDASRVGKVRRELDKAVGNMMTQ